MEKHAFQAEVSRLLGIVAHSLYSDKGVFLRELVSNASDACDRLRYLALTRPELAADDPRYRILLSIDRAARTLTVADNGIGMDREELVSNLGTIARSGTAAFLKETAAAGAGDLALIGEFGVGFYAAFMVAAPVEVVTRKAGDTQAWRWVSEGTGEFEVGPLGPDEDAPARGTRVVLHLRKGEDDYLDADRLRALVAKYSDHISFPILLQEGTKERPLNAASALWTRPKAEISERQYAEFYRHVAHTLDEPWLTLHHRAEGKIEYTALLFVPGSRPFDLFDPARRNAIRLYVKRVFITDQCEDLAPGYLRFLRGIVDSEDLPLSISREMLQKNPVLAKIRGGLTRKILGELAKKAKEAPQEYAGFWDNFGAVLKEGIYEDADQREALLALARFRSTASDGLVSLDDYVRRMKPGQDAIYTLGGDTALGLAKSPHLEGFAARGLEVLLLTDPVDEFWVPAVGLYAEKPFKSVTRGGAELDRFPLVAGEPPPVSGPGIDALVALLRLTLKDAVKDVRVSGRLTDSAVCLVAEEGDRDMHLERLLRRHRQVETATKRVLEVNARHPLVAALAARLAMKGAAEDIAEAAWLLLDQARILEGEAPADAGAFARRLTELMRRALAG